METMLSREQIEFYREYGFVQVENVLTADEVAELTEYMEEAMAAPEVNATRTDKTGGAYYRVLNQKVNTWRDHGGMAKFAFHPTLARMALELTGAAAIRLFHDHVLWKMPHDSKPTPWHQDLPYWPMNEPGALSIWLPVDDVDEQNGCMMFVSQSHKAGKLTGISFLEPQNIFDFVKDSEIAKQKPVIVPLKKGSCTFHHGLTFHYAHANVTDRPRRVLAMIYMPDGTTYSGKSHLCTDGLGLNVGEPIKGGLFPVLAKA
jgi:ectoine hydroxylase-related dioxygenase (phytanoyl-CoA dioxygenase family)